jgi:predicted RNA methylase
MREVLATPGATRYILEKYGIRARKKYGQNFLIDSNILDSIIEGADITGEDCVLEIGPGIGTMTQKLCAKARFVIAVEIDKKLIPILNDTLSEYDNKLILNEDALRADLERNWAVVAEAIQTILRREAYPNPYEALKALTRTNAAVTAESMQEFIDGLDVSDAVKAELKEIAPWNYTGV